MNEPWISNMGIVGGILGSIGGILGGVVGTLASAFIPKGKAKRLVLGSTFLLLFYQAFYSQLA